MSNQDRLLSDEELIDEISKIPLDTQMAIIDEYKPLLDLINTQKRLYAESVNENLRNYLNRQYVHMNPDGTYPFDPYSNQMIDEIRGILDGSIPPENIDVQPLTDVPF